MNEKTIKNWLKKIKLNESTISTLLGGFVVLIVGVLIFNYFKTGKTGEVSLEHPEEENQTSVTQTDSDKMMPNNLPKSHKVKPGESLWQISEKYYTSGYNWVDIAKENKLVNPNHLEVGEELKLPKTAIKQPVKKSQIAEKPENQNQTVKSESITADSYKVVKGDNLWKIAVRAYSDGYKWVEIAQVNHLTNPNYVEVGKELKLPR